MSTQVLVLSNAIHRTLYRPDRHWLSLLRGVDADVVHAPSARRVPTLSRYSHLILTGSEASILARRPWFDIEADAIREAAARGLSLLGSCFGHQLLVYALSGPQYLRKATPPEVGWTTLEKIENDPLFVDVPSPWCVFSFHFDEVVDPPPPWTVLARSTRCPVHVIRYGDLPIWGMQAHPEIAHWRADCLARTYLLVRRRAATRVVTAHRPPPRDRRDVASVVRRFLESGPAT